MLKSIIAFSLKPSCAKKRGTSSYSCFFVVYYLQDGGKLLLPPYRNSAAAQRESDQLADALSQLAIGFG